MSSPPQLPAFCLSETALRVDGGIQTTLEATRRILDLIGGTVTEQLPYTVTGVVRQPDGRRTLVEVAAYRVLGADYLELKHGDARPAATSAWHPREFAETETDLTPTPPGLALPRCARVSSGATLAKHQRAPQRPKPRPQHRATPLRPECVPAEDPLDVPPLSLGAAALEDAWETVEGIAAWPVADLRNFAAVHEDVCALFARGDLEALTLEQHMLNVPEPVRKGLKWVKRHWNCLPPNTGKLLEQVSMLLCEAEVFWALHGC